MMKGAKSTPKGSAPAPQLKGIVITEPVVPRQTVVQPASGPQDKGKEPAIVHLEQESSSDHEQGPIFSAAAHQRSPSPVNEGGGGGPQLGRGGLNLPESELPFQPRWDLKQGDRFEDFETCSEFLAACVPPAERIYQRGRDRYELRESFAKAVCNAVASGQEIWREWTALGEEAADARKRVKAAEKDAADSRKEAKTAKWELSTSQAALKAAEAKHLEAAEAWKVACSQQNKKLEASREQARRKDEDLQKALEANVALEEQSRTQGDLILSLSGEVEKLSAENARLVKEQAEASTTAERVKSDRQWLLSTGVPFAMEQAREGPEMVSMLAKLLKSAMAMGRKDGYAEGRAHAAANIPAEEFELHDQYCQEAFEADQEEFDNLEIPLAGCVEEWAGMENGVELFRKAREDSLAAENEEQVDAPPPS